MDWRELEIEEQDTEVTHCDCCGKRTVRAEGNVYSEHAFQAWYSAAWSDGHPDVPLRLNLYAGDWSEDAPQTSRWGILIDYRLGKDGGCALLDWPAEAREKSRTFTMLNRADLIGSDYVEEVWAMTDAILMKDSRIGERGA